MRQVTVEKAYFKNPLSTVKKFYKSKYAWEADYNSKGSAVLSNKDLADYEDNFDFVSKKDYDDKDKEFSKYIDKIHDDGKTPSTEVINRTSELEKEVHKDDIRGDSDINKKRTKLQKISRGEAKSESKINKVIEGLYL